MSVAKSPCRRRSVVACPPSVTRGPTSGRSLRPRRSSSKGRLSPGTASASSRRALSARDMTRPAVRQGARASDAGAPRVFVRAGRGYGPRMLSAMDDYPLHQIAEPIRFVGTSDRNFYDRYYFNLHASSGDLFMVMGLGLLVISVAIDGTDCIRPTNRCRIGISSFVSFLSPLPPLAEPCLATSARPLADTPPPSRIGPRGIEIPRSPENEMRATRKRTQRLGRRRCGQLRGARAHMRLAGSEGSSGPPVCRT